MGACTSSAGGATSTTQQAAPCAADSAPDAPPSTFAHASEDCQQPHGCVSAPRRSLWASSTDLSGLDVPSCRLSTSANTLAALEEGDATAPGDTGIREARRSVVGAAAAPGNGPRPASPATPPRNAYARTVSLSGIATLAVGSGGEAESDARRGGGSGAYRSPHNAAATAPGGSVPGTCKWSASDPTQRRANTVSPPGPGSRKFKWISSTMWTVGAVCGTCNSTARPSRDHLCRSCGAKQQSLPSAGVEASQRQLTPLSRFEEALQLKAMRLRRPRRCVAKTCSSASDDSAPSPGATAWKLSQSAAASPIDGDAFTPWFDRAARDGTSRATVHTAPASHHSANAPGPLYAPSLEAMDSFYVRAHDQQLEGGGQAAGDVWSPCSITSVTSGASAPSSDTEFRAECGPGRGAPTGRPRLRVALSGTHSMPSYELDVVAP